jgi:hypothetical protein
MDFKDVYAKTSCYESMFEGCTSLETIEALPKGKYINNQYRMLDFQDLGAQMRFSCQFSTFYSSVDMAKAYYYDKNSKKYWKCVKGNTALTRIAKGEGVYTPLLQATHKMVYGDYEYLENTSDTYVLDNHIMKMVKTINGDFVYNEYK